MARKINIDEKNYCESKRENAFGDYYQKKFCQLRQDIGENITQMQFRDYKNNGIETSWMNINNESRKELIRWLKSLELAQ